MIPPTFTPKVKDEGPIQLSNLRGSIRDYMEPVPRSERVMRMPTNFIDPVEEDDIDEPE